MNYRKRNQIISIGEGFSLWGFIFSWGWLLARGLWFFGILFMLIEIPLSFYAIAGNSFFGSIPENAINLHYSYLLIPSLLLLLIHIYIGSKGNSWLEKKITHRGFEKFQ